MLDHGYVNPYVNSSLNPLSNFIETFPGDDNVTDVVVDGGPLGPTPRDVGSGLIYFVIRVLVILILMQWFLHYCNAMHGTARLAPARTQPMRNRTSSYCC